MDLGIEVILALFCREGLERIFGLIEERDVELSDNGYRMYCLRDEYVGTIEAVMLFLQNKNPTLAHSICDETYLPEAGRFGQMEDLEWAFGTMGIHDKARHLATLYLEDLADLIKEAIDPYFGFSRYAERLGLALSDFGEMYEALGLPNTLVSEILVDLLAQKVAEIQPTLVCLSVPFPGNLFGALKCGQYLKKMHPDIKVVMGGGYPNTELRRLSEVRVFEYVDFVSLDDGEAPLSCLLAHLRGERPMEAVKRVFALQNGAVRYFNGATEKDVAQRNTGTPDYSDLRLHEYLSVIEIVNPMHRLWSDGRWNKLTLAHGCYWGKCTFCDISLSYIKDYEPLTAALLCDRIEEITAQTGQNGFHFVDEAAPPALLRDLAIEILRRKITVVWWTNIRFEKNFTYDLCVLLKASGCIAVSGGLEVASDRLLDLMKKGVTVAQVARVADAFTSSGIMVHAYLMYGFPTQTAQETVDSLEMVRQLFENGVIQSGFWHRFAMTAHSPVGLHPADFDVMKIGPDFGGFADNDLEHADPKGANHGLFSEGLRKSLFNYMHGICLDFPLFEWFDFKVPNTTIPKSYIARCLNEKMDKNLRKNALIIWLGNAPNLSIFEEVQGKKSQKSQQNKRTAELHFFNKKDDWILTTNQPMGEWLYELFEKVMVREGKPYQYQEFKADFEAANLGDFAAFLRSSEWLQLRENGFLLV